MIKKRFIPYGYTMRDGRTIIEHDEADVIRYIFDQYIKGASLNELAMELTRRKVPYTEKTTAWDKARIARIIDNSKYAGLGEYDPIIDDDIYEEAVHAKVARQMRNYREESDAVALLRNRVHCDSCGAPMVRRIDSRRKPKESWVCTDCGIRIRMSDATLLQKITIILNRIILNAELIVPRKKYKPTDSDAVALLQKEIDEELEQASPNEKMIMEKIGEIASQLYQESRAEKSIETHIIKQRLMLLQPIENFDGRTFTELINTVLIGADGKVSLVSKTDNIVTEGGGERGSNKNP